MRKLISTILFISVAYSSFTQNNKELNLYEDSIVRCFDNLLNYHVDSSKRTFDNQTIRVVNKRVLTSDSLKLAISNNILNLFNIILQKPESFSYPFNKLKNIYNIKSSDSLVRVITWNISLQNGSYKYFGLVQRFSKRDKSIQLFRFNDVSEKIRKPETSQLKLSKWYGALYYKILTNYHERKPYYTLLAWDGNNPFTTKKLIECFSFKGKKLILGMPIFKMHKEIKNRLIFEYSKQVNMMLRYDKNIKMIVFDHLAPSNERFRGQYLYYGPDMSQDGIEFIKGNWVLKENLNLKNMNISKPKEEQKSDILTGGGKMKIKHTQNTKNKRKR